MNFHICDKWTGIWLGVGLLFGIFAGGLYYGEIYNWAKAFGFVGVVLTYIYGIIGAAKLNGSKERRQSTVFEKPIGQLRRPDTDRTTLSGRWRAKGRPNRVGKNQTRVSKRNIQGK